MRIGLYNLEPKYKNLALEKVRCYHQRRGDEVLDSGVLSTQGCDLVYASSIFDWTPKTYISDTMLTGGTGFDLTTQLPPEIEAIEPHQNFGFTSRGCIRNCKFCVVPRKEGKIRATGDLLSLWDGKAKDVTLLDNNILALPEHFDLICRQAREHKVRLDFNQGLDFRLLTPDIVDLLKSISHTEYRFAFDHPSYLLSVERAIELLQAKGIKRCSWYVLCGFDTTIEQDLARLNYLRERNQIAFVQRYRRNGQKPSRELVALARWANQHHIFRSMTFGQFLEHPDNVSYKKHFQQAEVSYDL